MIRQISWRKAITGFTLYLTGCCKDDKLESLILSGLKIDLNSIFK